MAEYNNQGNNGGGNGAPAKVKTLLDDPFLRLSAPCPTPAGAGKKSTLRVVLAKNGPQSLMNPHLVVYTNDPTEKDRDTNYGKITGKFDYLSWGMFMELLESAIDWAPGEKKFVDCREHIFANGKRSEQPVMTARVTVGKDPAGVISVSVVAKNRPIIVFPLLPPPGFHEFKNADGTPLTDAEVSILFTKSYCKRLAKTVGQLMVDMYVAPAPMEFNGAQNGGGQNRGQQQGGGGVGGNNYNKGNGGGQAASSGGGGWGGDDEIPF